jgi:ankyrin repeat protein
VIVLRVIHPRSFSSPTNKGLNARRHFYEKKGVRAENPHANKTAARMRYQGMCPEHPKRKSPEMIHSTIAANITGFAHTTQELDRASEMKGAVIDRLADEVAAEEARYAELQMLAFDFARDGDSLALDRMVSAGLPVNLRNGKGHTLLMLAAYHGHADTVDTLVARGADVDARNDRGQTPLGGAAFKGHDAVVKTLLDAGADAKADQGFGITAAGYAMMFGRFRTAKIIRAHVAKSRAA